MTNVPNPNDPYRPTNDQLRDPARLDSELQADPELREGPASGSRMALYALGIVLVLGAVFYGLNNSSMNADSTKTASQSTTEQSTPRAPGPTNNIADSNSKPPVAPGVRDVTPPPNSEPGVTTGAAPARPAQPPQSGPTGTQIDTSKGGAR